MVHYKVADLKQRRSAIQAATHWASPSITACTVEVSMASLPR